MNAGGQTKQSNLIKFVINMYLANIPEYLFTFLKFENFSCFYMAVILN